MDDAHRTLDQTEQKWLQERWHKIDQSGDGMLDLHELSVFLESLKTGMSTSEKAQAFHDIDTDGTGSVEFFEFYDWYSMQDAEKFKDIMYNGARHQLLVGALACVLGLAVPWMGIAYAMDLQEQPRNLFVVVMVMVVVIGGLILACFYDAYGPVIEAQTQAAQQKAFNIAVTVGQASVDVALAASSPKTALSTIKAHVDGKLSPRHTTANPLDDPSVSSEPMFEKEPDVRD